METSPSKYIQEAVWNVEDHLQSKGDQRLTKRSSAPFPAGYSPELDTCEELKPDDVAYYQSQIGILHWMIELG